MQMEKSYFQLFSTFANIAEFSAVLLSKRMASSHLLAIAQRLFHFIIRHSQHMFNQTNYTEGEDEWLVVAIKSTNFRINYSN